MAAGRGVQRERTMVRPHTWLLLFAVAVLKATALATGSDSREAMAATQAEASGLVSSDDLGSVDFPTSASAEAQSHFIRGIKLLHSFEFPEARASFERAQAIEPDFAMAYWGEAMTHYAPLWESIDEVSARAALAKLAATAEERRKRAPSEREKAYFDAIEVLFADGSFGANNAAFAASLERMAARFPDDLEAQAFQALAVIGSAGGRDYAIYERAADIAANAFARNPRHPGAAHYLIHATDDPAHARRGLEAAHMYGSIAPASPHALHMPAHIFLPLGMWEEAAAANQASIRSASPGSTHAYHAYPWLLQAYLQLGRYQDARALLDDVAADDSYRAERAWKRMRDLYVVETRTCPDELMGSDAPRGTGSGAAFARGLCALWAGDLAASRASAADLDDGFGDARILGPVLEARIALAAGDEREAIRLARRAVAAEEEVAPTRDEYGPGTPLEPPEETLGDCLLAAGHVDEARAAFARALDVRPNRVHGLRGLIRAAEQSGETSLASSARAHLRAMWHGADSELRSNLGLAPTDSRAARPLTLRRAPDAQHHHAHHASELRDP